MPVFPFSRYPLSYYYRYQRPDYYSSLPPEKQDLHNLDEPSALHDTNNFHDKNIASSTSENCTTNSFEPIFEILGIKLYLDDIIILVLLFFLYSEGVKDEMLFLVLILLLLT